MAEAVILPSNPDAERKLIASVMDDATNLPGVAGVKPDYFFRQAHRLIWRAIVALHNRGEAPLFEAVLHELQITGKLADVGGEGDFLTIAGTGGMNPGDFTQAGAQALARTIMETYEKRMLVRMAEKASASGYDMGVDSWRELGDAYDDIKNVRAVLAAGSFGQVTLRIVAQSARELMEKEIPPARWAVPNLFAEGLNLLAGKPKKGKSTLALQICKAIAEENGVVLGQIEVSHGEALYLALEDNERRMQRRLDPMLRHNPDGDALAPEGLYFRYEWPRLNEGGIEALDEWMTDHPRTRIICVDTFAKVKPRAGNKNTTLYDADYEAVDPLQRWAIKNCVAVVLILHLRKSKADSTDDVIDEISGSTGLTGAADNIIVMRKSEGITSLHRQGRDFIDDEVWALNGDPETLQWEVAGTLQDVKRSSERQAILDALYCAPEGLSPVQIAQATHQPQVNTRRLLKKMLDGGDTQLVYQRDIKLYRHRERVERVEREKESNGSNRSNNGNGGNGGNVTGEGSSVTGHKRQPVTHAKPDAVWPDATSVTGVTGVTRGAYYTQGPRRNDACAHCGAHRWGLVEGVDTCMSCHRPWQPKPGA